MAAKRTEKKRLGKKHRQASTRPKLGKTAPRGTATTGAVSPKKRKELAAKKAAAVKVSKTPTKSPDREHRVVARHGLRSMQRARLSSATGGRRRRWRRG
jgi:GTP-binding protein